MITTTEKYLLNNLDMKYTISLSGRGGDIAIFPITEEQFNYLQENDVESDNMSYDEICEYLEFEDLFSSSEHMVTGAYLSECFISVMNEETGEEVWNSENDSGFVDTEWKDGGIEGSDYLAVEDYVKGEFFTFYLETEEEFNPDKLIPIITEVAEVRDIITSFIYDGDDLSDTKEYSDYWSKGFNYILYKNN
jgi:hypothetical protein